MAYRMPWIPALGILAVAGALLAAPSPAPARAQAPAHPLDGLSAAEYARVVAALRLAGRVGPETRFHSVALDEPAKESVLEWRPGLPFPRRAVAIVSERGRAAEAVVDLAAGTLAAYTPVEGQPALLVEEFTGATAIALGDPRMVAGLARRGVSPEQAFCLPLTAGAFGAPEEAGRRLLKVPCYVRPTGSNWYARPVEGLFATVDMASRTVLDVTDTGIVPVQPDGWGYTGTEVGARLGTLRPALRPTALAQPDGGNVTIAGGQVQWDIWRFRLRVDKRPGVVLSMLEVRDVTGGPERWRSMAYQMHLSEVFVPYMDPDAGWYFRTYMDSGEYGFGVFLSPLRRGVDCPAHAAFLPATIAQDDGSPADIPDAVCIFERNIGDPAWRHFEFFAQASDRMVPAEGRPATELVVRSASEVGNYDYLIDYVFQQDGTIRVAVGATGLDAVKGVAAQSMRDPTAAADTRHGTLVAPNLVAPYHSHYFNFRLDLDIDGPVNDFMRMRLVPRATEPGLPRRSIFAVEHEMPATELAARTRIDPRAPAALMFQNGHAAGPLGHAPGYMLSPGGSWVAPLLDEADPPVRRNPYIAYQLWVTPYDPQERYAGGRYPVMSTGADTLGTWAARDRPIRDRDIVAWYTVGFHHITRTEDWPVMPTHWFAFALMPHNFFAHSPTLSLPDAP